LQDFDIYPTFIEQWTEQNNKFNDDFYLYSTLNHAISDKEDDRWEYCNFDYSGSNVGFPRDCSVSVFPATNEWITEKADGEPGFGSRKHYKFDIVGLKGKDGKWSTTDDLNF